MAMRLFFPLRFRALLLEGIASSMLCGDLEGLADLMMVTRHGNSKPLCASSATVFPAC